MKSLSRNEYEEKFCEESGKESEKDSEGFSRDETEKMFEESVKEFEEESRELSSDEFGKESIGQFGVKSGKGCEKESGE